MALRDAQLVPWEVATTGGCVCRGEHRSSAAGASDNNAPMQIRKPTRVRICIGVLQLGGLYRGRPMAAPTAKHAPRSTP